MAQQRHAPSPSRGDAYGGGGHGQRDAGAYHGGHGAPPQQSYNQGPPPPQHYAQPPSHYGGPPPQHQQPQQGYGGYGNDQYNQAGGMGSARRRSEY